LDNAGPSTAPQDDQENVITERAKPVSHHRSVLGELKLTDGGQTANKIPLGENPKKVSKITHRVKDRAKTSDRPLTKANKPSTTTSMKTAGDASAAHSTNVTWASIVRGGTSPTPSGPMKPVMGSYLRGTHHNNGFKTGKAKARRGSQPLKPRFSKRVTS